MGAGHSGLGTTFQVKRFHFAVDLLLLGVVWSTTCLHDWGFRLQAWRYRVLLVSVVHFGFVESCQRFRRGWLLPLEDSCTSIVFNWRFIENFITVLPWDQVWVFLQLLHDTRIGTLIAKNRLVRAASSWLSIWTRLDIFVLEVSYVLYTIIYKFSINALTSLNLFLKQLILVH